jgi:hypothetical protein
LSFTFLKLEYAECHGAYIRKFVHDLIHKY